ncbi:hypothetical protein K32_14320 [Kaistia sp. 32K]|uniref:bestrophin-like domain n=1 Tax=Kaistia sp. 32K TaxID=2795690 RepID=UPI0019152B93|nr:hypothetical protein [Kaistia sp. 32K]BCP52815.1 hypothetical protein K32_14320 [Kaistia sp. 32K]
MESVYQLSVQMLFFLFAVFGIGFYLVGRLALYSLSRHASHDIFSMPQPAFLGTIATAWALSLGFIAADIWAVNSKADEATSMERSTISRLLRSAEPDILDSQRLAEGVIAYRKDVAIKEWLQGKNVEPDPDVEKTLHDIHGEIALLARGGAPSPLISQVIRDFSDLQEARNLRLAVGNTSIDFYKWYLVMFLTLLTAITLAATHADRARAGRRALAIYAVTASVSLWILAIHANPYDGLEELHPSLLFTNHKQVDLALEP